MVEGTYFSDVLCIWAYVAQERTEALRRTFGAEVQLRHRFCNVFGDAREKIATGWRDRESFAGYARHVAAIAARFPHISVHPDVWTRVRPATSLSPHLFLHAVRLYEGQSGIPHDPLGLSLFEQAMKALREAFFVNARDIATASVQADVARALGIDPDALRPFYDDGTANAALAGDYHDADKQRIEGSPTLLLNEGRQRLFGNVGFRVIEANIRELLREPGSDQASWC